MFKRLILGVLAIISLAGCDDALSVPPASPGSGKDDPTWTEGDGGVTDDGAATYTVPIWVPPGRSGMAPKLALTYSSRAGNGLAGFGWKLARMSAIAPCARQVLIDGVSELPAYDGYDALCLDGIRLVPAIGALGGGYYRLLGDGRVRVDHLQAGFRVWYPDGRIATFGVEADAVMDAPRGEGDATNTLGWLLSSIEDRSGNTIRYRYASQQTPVENAYEYWPTEIQYTNHSELGPGQRFVRFEYAEGRTDHILHFKQGAAVATTRLLKRILMHAPVEPGGPALLVRYYDIQHVSSNSGRALVRWIRECDGKDNCRAPIGFDYSPAAGALNPEVRVLDTQEASAHHWFGFAGAQAYVGSFLGGAQEQLIYRGGRNWNILSVEDGVVSVRWLGASEPDEFVPLDHDQNGYTDLLWADRGRGESRVARIQLLPGEFSETLAGLTTIAELPPPECVGGTARIADIDANGTPDLVYGCGDEWKVVHNNGGGWVSFPGEPELLATGSTLAIGDFDADGRLDSSTDSTGNLQLDVNGDGLLDNLRMERSGLTISWNTGAGRFTPARPALVEAGPLAVLAPFGALDGRPVDYSELSIADFRIADMNGDGRLDLVAHEHPPVRYEASPSPRRLLVYHSTGYGFVLARTIAIAELGNITNGGGYHLVDLDGNGLPEILADGHFREPFLPRYAALVAIDPQHQIPDLLTRVRREAPGDDGRDDFRFIHEYQSSMQSADGCAYPEVCGGNRVVVRKHMDAIGTWYVHEFAFPRSAVDGNGVSGFEMHRFYDDSNRRVVTREFDFTRDAVLGYTFAGRPKREQIWTRDEQYRFSMVEERTETAKVLNLSTGGYFVAPHDITHKVWQVDGTPPPWPCTGLCGPPAPSEEHLVSESTVAFDYRASGAMYRRVESVPGIERRTTELSAWDDRPEQWLFGLPQSVEVTAVDVSGRSRTRTDRYGWDASGRLDSLESNDGLFTADPEYTASGNLKSVTLAAGDDEPRTTLYTYDPAEQLLVQRSTNPMGHERVTIRSPATGAVLSDTPPSGVETTYTLDGFGRPETVTRAGVTWEAGYTLGSRYGDWGTVTLSWSGPSVRTHQDVDKLGRVHQIRREGWSGSVTEGIEYDKLGRPSTWHLPHYDAELGAMRTVTWDAADRIRTVDFADGQPGIQVSFGPRSRTVLSRLGQDEKLEYDIAGRITRSLQPGAATDGRDAILRYAYGPFGLLEEIRDQRGNRWSTEYDSHERRSGAFDPDTGWTCFGLNAYGELITEREGSESLDQPCSIQPGTFVASYSRDRLGRLQETEHNTDGLTEFFWDEAIPGALDGTRRHFDDVWTAIEYGEFARPKTETTIIGEEKFRFDYQYDTLGRLDVIEYPETANGRLRVGYSYNDRTNGALERVYDAVTGEEFWFANDRDAFGRATQASQTRDALTLTTTRNFDPSTTRLNTLSTVDQDDVALQDYEFSEWDADGNLLTRFDQVSGVVSSYLYDRKGRVTSWHSSEGEESYEYDDVGNMTSIAPGPTLEFRGPGPHWLTRRQGEEFARYDNRGRRYWAADGFSATYNAFDLPEELTSRGTTSNFDYDALGKRVRRRTRDAEVINVGAYERRRVTESTTELMSIWADGAVVAQVIDRAHGEKGRPREVEFILNDHLGSPDTLVSEAGDVLERYRFSPYGKRRVLGPDGEIRNPRSSRVQVGFTGHEEGDGSGLIDMGGRFYDSVTGAFLTPDPIIRSALDRASFNAYRYAAGNPIRFRDPSGFDPCDGSDPAGCAAGGWVGSVFGLIAGAFASHASSHFAAPDGGGASPPTYGSPRLDPPPPPPEAPPPPIVAASGASSGRRVSELRDSITGDASPGSSSASLWAPASSAPVVVLPDPIEIHARDLPPPPGQEFSDQIVRQLVDHAIRQAARRLPEASDSEVLDEAHHIVVDFRDLSASISNDLNYVAADHYLTARLAVHLGYDRMGGDFGAFLTASLGSIGIPLYNIGKILGVTPRSGPQPLSEPDVRVEQWSYLGMADALADFWVPTRP